MTTLITAAKETTGIHLFSSVQALSENREIGPAVTIIFIFCEVLARANEIADALSCLTNVAEEYIKFVANTAECHKR